MTNVNAKEIERMQMTIVKMRKNALDLCKKGQISLAQMQDFFDTGFISIYL